MKRTTVGFVLGVLIGSLLAGPATLQAQEIGTPAATPAAAATAAVYMTIANGGCMPDQLLGATTDVADGVEIHQTAKDGDSVAMRPLTEGLTVLAGGTTTLEPGGDHLMLIGLREDLVAGDRFLLSLSFLFSGDVSVPVNVRGDVEPSSDQTPSDPASIGTIRVADAWTRATVSPIGTPAASDA
jgi:periplasmic copper chaperone A